MRPVWSLLMMVPVAGSVGVSMDPHLTEIERRPDRGVLLTAYGAAGAVALDDGAGGGVGWCFHGPAPYRNQAAVG